MRKKQAQLPAEFEPANSWSWGVCFASVPQPLTCWIERALNTIYSWTDDLSNKAASWLNGWNEKWRHLWREKQSDESQLKGMNSLKLNLDFLRRSHSEPILKLVFIKPASDLKLLPSRITTAATFPTCVGTCERCKRSFMIMRLAFRPMRVGLVKERPQLTIFIRLLGPRTTYVIQTQGSIQLNFFKALKA